MFKKKELSRLGDILVSKGLITQDQLESAIQEQSRRKRLLDPADATLKVTPIGEILIELGFIDQLQLKRGLNWQARLRHASIAMALCAPFMMFAPSVAASTVRLAPITVEAENYSAMQGITQENTKDVGGGKNIGYFDAGDWLNYENTALTIPTTGTYKITYRVANRDAGGVMLLKNLATGAVLDTISIPKTGGWQTWVDVERTVTLQQGAAKLQLYAQVGGFNVNWFKIESAEPEALPKLIQVESYSTMSGIVFESTTDAGGGSGAGYLDAGDWLNYEKAELTIPTAGAYKVTYRVANRNTGGVLLLKNLATGAVMDTVTIPKTGGWQTWVDVVQTVNFAPGVAKLQLYVQAGGFNINWFKVESISTGSSSSSSVTPPVIISSSSSSSSSKPAVSSSSSAPAVISSSSSSSSKPAVSSSSSSSANSSSPSHVAGPIGISWTAPTKRENGTDLYIEELGGYEIRYKKLTDTQYTYVSINDAWTQQYKFDWLEGDYVFQIAAFDKNGVYSPFVDIRRE